MSPELPRRIPGAPETPHRTGSASFALLIRVATGLDAWAERDHAKTLAQEDEWTGHGSGRG